METTMEIKLKPKPKINFEHYIPGTNKYGPKWIPRENWCIEIDGQRYYGAWTKEDAERVTKF